MSETNFGDLTKADAEYLFSDSFRHLTDQHTCECIEDVLLRSPQTFTGGPLVVASNLHVNSTCSGRVRIGAAIYFPCQSSVRSCRG